MKKYQIFAPDGKKVCIIEAQTVKYFQMNNNDKYCHVVFKDDRIAFEVLESWGIIPLDMIVVE